MSDDPSVWRRLDAVDTRYEAAAMSHAELKSLVDRSSTEERLFLAAYLRHVSTGDDGSLQGELAGAHREIGGGRKVRLSQLQRLHQALTKTGL